MSKATQLCAMGRCGRWGYSKKGKVEGIFEVGVMGNQSGSPCDRDKLCTFRIR